MKKYVKKIILLVLVLIGMYILIPSNVYAECLSVDFEKTITADNNVLKKGQKLSNGNYVFVGNTYSQIPGDNYYGDFDSTVYILDSNKNIIKNRTIGERYYDFVEDVLIIDDEKFLVQSFFSANNGKTVLSLYNNDGDLLEEKEYNNCRNFRFKKIDDKIYLTHSTYSNSEYRYYFGILNSDLDITYINDNTPADLTMVDENRFIDYYGNLVYNKNFELILDYSDLQEDENFMFSKMYMSSKNILYVFGYKEKLAKFEYEGQTIDYMLYDFVVKRYDENFEFLDEHKITENQYSSIYNDTSNYIYEIYENENGSLNIVFQEYYIYFEFNGGNLLDEQYLQTHFIKLDETGYMIYDYKYLKTDDKNYKFFDIIKENDFTYSFVIYTYLKLFGEGTYNKAKAGIVTITENNFTSDIDYDEFVNVDYNDKDYLMGDKISFDYTIDLGYKLKSIKVYDKDSNEDITDEVNLNVENKKLYTPARNITVKFETEKVDYKFIEGMGSSYQGNFLKFVIDGEYSLFEDLYIDEKLVDKNKYTIKSGSTIITLASDYLDTLNIGEHVIKATYTNGSTPETNFSVVKKNIPNDNNKENTKSEEIKNSEADSNVIDKETKKENTESEEIKNSEADSNVIDKETKEENISSSPKTEDNIVIYIVVMLVSALGIAVTIKFIKKRT